MLPGNLHAADESLPAVKPGAGAAGALGVCHIASGDLWAGAEAQTASLLKYLARDSRLELCALVMNPGHLAQAIEDLGISVQVIPEAENSFRDIVRNGDRYLAGRKVQIIHSHRYKENLLAARLARRCKIPHLVRTQHGLPEPFDGFRAIKQRLIRSLDTRVARRSTARVIGVSAEMTRQLASRINAEKIATIPNGVDLESVQSGLTAQQARERLGVPADCAVIGTAGRLEPVKRLDLFLKAAAEIARERPSARFVIAGEGRERKALRALAESLGLGERALFLGHRDNVYDVLRAFDALVISSDHEGLPMVLLEALALGVPVVARAVGGIPEVIQNGVSGVLVDSSDPRDLAQACLTVLSSRSRAERLIAGGLRTVQQNYSAAQTAARVAELYFSVVARA